LFIVGIIQNPQTQNEELLIVEAGHELLLLGFKGPKRSQSISFGPF
jgi:hypothetical protein